MYRFSVLDERYNMLCTVQAKRPENGRIYIHVVLIFLLLVAGPTPSTPILSECPDKLSPQIYVTHPHLTIFFLANSYISVSQVDSGPALYVSLESSAQQLDPKKKEPKDELRVLGENTKERESAFSDFKTSFLFRSRPTENTNLV